MAGIETTPEACNADIRTAWNAATGNPSNGGTPSAWNEVRTFADGIAGRLGWIGWRARTAPALAIVVIGGLGLAFYGSRLSASSNVSYRLAAIDAGPIVNVITTSGTVKPLAAVLVGSQASGQIKELPADFNSVVKQGDVIARLNDDTVAARLAQARVDVEVASTAALIQRAQLERSRSDAESAHAAAAVAKAETERADVAVKDTERDLNRKRDLSSRGISTMADREHTEAAFDAARAQLAAARAREIAAVANEASAEAAIRTVAAQLDNATAQVKQRQSVVDGVRVDLDHTVIRAPIDGIVIERNVEVGQTVAASLQAPILFTIAPDLRAMEVHANVDEADIGRVARGQEVSFVVDAFPGRAFTGHVVDIRKVPQTTQNVVAYTVVISAENDELLLLPGMTANVKIVVSKRDRATRVPNAALRFRPADALSAPVVAKPGAGNAQVWVLGTSGVAEARAVTLGLNDGSRTEVVTGDVRDGDRVIVGVDAQSPNRSAFPGS